MRRPPRADIAFEPPIIKEDEPMHQHDRAVISSDWHFKFGDQFDRATPSGVSCRIQEVLDSVLWTCEVGKRQKASIFIGAGDIFERAERLPTKEGLLIQQALEHIRKQFKYCFFIPGNHDLLSRESSILALFQSTVTVFNKPSFVDLPTCRLYFVPFIREATEFYNTLSSITASDTINKKYLIAHFWDNQSMPLDPEAIDLSKLPTGFFDRVFCGHYHVPSKNPEDSIIYSGALLNHHFGETGRKGCWVTDFTTNKTEFFANPHSPEFITCLDTNLLHLSTSEALSELSTNAYYRVYCDPENVLDITNMLSSVKGFELLHKQEADAAATTPAVLAVEGIEKKNLQSFTDYILSHCEGFKPDNVTSDEFIEVGKSLLLGV